VPSPFKVDHQLELRRLFDGQLVGPGALEDLVGIDRGTAIHGPIEWPYLNSTRTGWHTRVEGPKSRAWRRSISSHRARVFAPL
jgi:hypothetical protein